MKKVILTFIAAVATLGLQAQNINAEGDHEQTMTGDEMKARCCTNCTPSGWVLDINAMGGILNQTYTANNPTASYINPVTTTTSDMKFNNGMSYAFEAQGGYFFGKKRNWGIGLGFMYMYQTGNVTMDQFHAEYQSYDNFGNIFRQEVTSAGQIKEDLRMSSFNIPLVAKYQTMFSKHVGFTADAGLLFNLHVQNNYNTNAAFDYEAVYQYQVNEGQVSTTYDANPTPAASDLIIRRNQYPAIGTTDVQTYFNTLRSEGYNVGLGVKPASNTGHVSYSNGSFGFLLRPAVSIYLCQYASLNLGLYYYYQSINNTAASNYHITDKVGQYSSMLNTVTNATNSSYGVTVGLRIKFCKKAAAAPPVTEPAPEPEAQQPEQPVASPVEEQPEETAHVDISTPMLFDLNKVTIKESSIPTLQEAVKELKENPNATLTIHGYTDNTGTANYNMKLSRRRAAVVKNYLKKHGVNPKILKAVGHGESHPAASNKTREGRMRNRRVIMKMKEKKAKVPMPSSKDEE